MNDFQWDRSGRCLLVADSSGALSLYHGATFDPLFTIRDYHMAPCNAIAIDPGNRYFVTGGNDSLIGVWNMQELMVERTISGNDSKVLALSVSHDGQFVGAICEDDVNKRY